MTRLSSIYFSRINPVPFTRSLSRDIGVTQLGKRGTLLNDTQGTLRASKRFSIAGVALYCIAAQISPACAQIWSATPAPTGYWNVVASSTNRNKW